MAKDLRDSWKDTGKGLGHAFRDLGKSLIKTGAKAVTKANEWASRDDEDEKPTDTEETKKED